MSIEPIAARAGVGKTTISRWYNCKEKLVAEALESVMEGVSVPDTGNFCEDIDALIFHPVAQPWKAHIRCVLEISFRSADYR